MEVRIRQATQEDSGLILQLIRELAEYENLLEHVTATESLLEKFGFGANRFFHVVIAENSAEEPMGLALYFYKFSTFSGKPTLYLEDLIVREAHRGHGIGKKLILHLVEVANANECEKMEWVVLDWNESAIKFYEGLGAEMMPDWRIMRLGPDAITAILSRGK